MPATTSDPRGLAAKRAAAHPNCWVCSGANEHGLAVDYREDGTGAVEATFPCHEIFTGYPGFLHGGIVSALLDGAMTNCLMIHRDPGVTADLQVRFRHPVRIGKPATVRAWLERSRGRVHLLGAELRQEGEILATATGKFMSHPDGKESPTKG